MAEAKAASLGLADIDTVVDADFHMSESQDDFIDYIGEPFDTLLSRGEEAYSSYLTDFYPSGGILTPAATGKIQNEPIRSHGDILRAMDEFRLDKVIVTPTLNLHLPSVQHDDLAAALASAFNEWMLDEVVSGDDGIYDAPVIAPQKPDRAAEEIDDRAGEPSVVGITFPGSGVHPPMGDETYWPIYEACEDNDLPLLVHNAADAFGTNYSYQFRSLKRYFPSFVVGHPIPHMINISSMMTEGVPERFPDLDVVWQESGLGWIPYLMRRLDHGYHEHREDVPVLEQPPSEYMRDSFYYTSQPIEGTDDPEYVSHTVRFFDGADSLMMSTDYPHMDFDRTEELLSLLQGFDEEEVRRIYGGTAMELFDC